MSDAIGSIGFLLLLGAFGLNATGKMDRSSPIYDILNIVGAAILGWYALEHAARVFVLLEATWALIALAALTTKVSRGNRTPPAPR
jgi:arginine exporter protein ArgO